MRKALVITFSKLTTDARVKRQIGFLKNLGFEITAAGYDSFDSEIKFVKINPPPLSLFTKIKSGALLLSALYSKAYNILYGQKLDIETNFDLIIANDIEALPLAFKLKGSAKIIFDAHEYAPRHFEDKLMWRIFFQGFNKFLCNEYIPRVDGMITVGGIIADEYEKHYKVKPVVITNAPHYSEINPFPVNPSKIRLVHQGIATPSRKLELMFDVMDQLDDRFSLDLLLLEPTHRSNKIYLTKLKQLASRNGRINFIPPVTTDKLIPLLNQYDIGIIIIPPINFNYQNTLPNKFFECVQARLAIAAGPLPEVAKLIDKFNVGVVSDDFTSANLAMKITELTPEKINEFKKNSAFAARELSAETNELAFTKLLQETLNVKFT